MCCISDSVLAPNLKHGCRTDVNHVHTEALTVGWVRVRVRVRVRVTLTL